MDHKRYSDLAIDDGGNILTLVCKGEHDSPYTITRCDRLGHPIATLEMKNLPTLYATNFFPNSLIAQNGFICLIDKVTMNIVVTDGSGNFMEGYDITAISSLGNNNEPVTGITDVSVDADGNIVSTISTDSSSAIMSLSRKSMKYEGCDPYGKLSRGVASLLAVFAMVALNWIFTAVCMITESSFFCNAND